jgi:pyruvate dehydrogenase E1 component alpha subunit
MQVDGMNALAVKAATEMVTNYVRKGNGPYVMEMNTYRYVGHSMSDPGITYRTREEISAVRAERDPIDKVKAWLLNYKLATEDEISSIDAAAKKEMDEAVEFSQNSPFPEPGELFTDVYTHPESIRAVERINSFTPSK